MACLDRETAMAYLRGDLDPDEAEQWSAHVANCEACRLRLEEVSEMVDDVRHELMVADVTSEQDWTRLEELIDQQTAGRSSEGRSARLNASAVAAVAASLVIAAAVFWNPWSAVSAAEILERATLAERARQEHAGSVVHRVLTLEERRGPARTLVSRHRVEGWRKTGTRASARRAFDERGRLLAAEWIDANGRRTVQSPSQPTLESPAASSSPAEYLAAGQAWQVELSATAFSTLLASPDAVRVTKAAGTISISYESGAPGPITAAMLRLSASDLRAIEQTIQIGRGEARREYRFAEDRVAVLAADAVPVAVFEPEPAAPDRGAAPPSRPARAAAPVNAGRLFGLEIEALRLLNDSGALLGEQVTVSRTRSHVRIQAMVDSEERRQELQRAIEPLVRERQVEIDIQTFAAMAERQPDGASAVRFRDVDIPGGDIPVGPQLRRYLGAATGEPATPEILEAVRAFANRVVEDSGLLVRHAWAVKRVQARYSPQEAAALTSEARATWRRMISEHAIQVVAHAEALRASLHPVFFPGQEAPRPEAPDDRSPPHELRAVIERLLDAAHTQDQAVRSAFSASSATAGSGTFVSTTQFFDRLNELITLARRVDAGQQEG